MKRPWTQNYGGSPFYYDDVANNRYDILDIAHQLAQVNRYGGSCIFPLSVAQHSTILAAALYREAQSTRGMAMTEAAEWALDGLFHDAPEAYLGDIKSPQKRMPSFADYRQIEADTDRAIRLRFRRLGVPATMLPKTHEFDTRIVLDEKAQVLKQSRMSWDMPGVRPLGVRIQRIEWEQARYDWLRAVSMYHSIWSAGKFPAR